MKRKSTTTHALVHSWSRYKSARCRHRHEHASCKFWTDAHSWRLRRVEEGQCLPTCQGVRQHKRCTHHHHLAHACCVLQRTNRALPYATAKSRTEGFRRVVAICHIAYMSKGLAGSAHTYANKSDDPAMPRPAEHGLLRGHQRRQRHAAGRVEHLRAVAVLPLIIQIQIGSSTRLVVLHAICCLVMGARHLLHCAAVLLEIAPVWQTHPDVLRCGLHVVVASSAVAVSRASALAARQAAARRHEHLVASCAVGSMYTAALRTARHVATRCCVLILLPFLVGAVTTIFSMYLLTLWCRFCAVLFTLLHCLRSAGGGEGEGGRAKGGRRRGFVGGIVRCAQAHQRRVLTPRRGHQQQAPDLHAHLHFVCTQSTAHVRCGQH